MITVHVTQEHIDRGVRRNDKTRPDWSEKCMAELAVSDALGVPAHMGFSVINADDDNSAPVYEVIRQDVPHTTDAIMQFDSGAKVEPFDFRIRKWGELD